MAKKTLSFTLEITAAPDFFPEINPVSLKVAKGIVAVYQISFTAQGGFTGPVNLAVVGLPIGALGAFDKPSINIGETARLSITTANAILGIFTLSVEAVAPDLL